MAFPNWSARGCLKNQEFAVSLDVTYVYLYCICAVRKDFVVFVQMIFIPRGIWFGCGP